MSGSSQEGFQADAYEQDGSDWVFSVPGEEVLRIPLDQVAAITKGN